MHSAVMDDDERRQSYGSDIAYGTNNEFGFDYLRDNMKFDVSHCVQRPHQSAGDNHVRGSGPLAH